jgi:hypothetical protein
MPLFIIRKQVRAGVTIIPSNENLESLERSLVVNFSDKEALIDKLISKYLAEVEFFKIA